jgi:hypothetical protein
MADDNKVKIEFDNSSANTVQNTVPVNSYPEHLIKPKYVEDKSVFYKKSGYLKDLLGEEN